MPDRGSYRLTDLLVFSRQTYERLFERYNLDMWPFQAVALLFGCAIIVLVVRNPKQQGRIISAILAACWLWVAWAFHLQRFATLHWAAPFFAAAFAAQAALLIWVGVIRNLLIYRTGTRLMRPIGLGVFCVALVIQPILTAYLGQKLFTAEIFGIATDPTVVGTVGLLLLVAGRAWWVLSIIPLMWCALNGATLWALASPNVVILLKVVMVWPVLAILKKWVLPNFRN